MKRIYMTLGIIGALATGASAQKTVDMELSFLQPAMNQNFANLNTGDTFRVFFIIKNNGPAAITESDTIKITGQGFAQNTTGQYNITYTLNPIAIAAGSQDTIGLAIRQGQNYGTPASGGPVLATFPSNSMDTMAAFAFGKDVTGAPFTDAGYDPAETPPYDVEGNNVTAVVYSFGTLTSIKDLVGGLAKQNITVSPNPTTKDISFEYNFTKATNATMRITDVAGRTVLVKDFGKNNIGTKKFTVEVSELNAGTYFMEFVTEDQRGISTFVVRK